MTSPIQSVVVFGANSAIATAYCRILAGRGVVFHLVGRDHDALQSLAADFDVRGAKKVTVAIADLRETEQHAQLVEEAWEQIDGPDLVLLAHGVLGRQAEDEVDWESQQVLIQTNLVSHLSLLTLLANRLEKQGSGCLAAISSVAGDRGRASNYIYGAAKAGLSCYLQGLQQRLAPAVSVLDLRPGPVDTPMTTGMQKGTLWSSPERVARAMDRGLGKRSGTLYLPFYWRPIMAVIRLTPATLLRKLGI